MSDGNFNRQLLPHTPYHSGLQVGRQQMRQRAVDALRNILKTKNLPATEQEDILRHFIELL